MGAHTWMRIFYLCSAGQQVSLIKKDNFFNNFQVQDSTAELVHELSHRRDGCARVRLDPEVFKDEDGTFRRTRDN